MAAGAPETSSDCQSLLLFLDYALSSSGVNGLSCRTGTEVPNEQKLLGEDGCSANELVAAHITEAAYHN